MIGVAKTASEAWKCKLSSSKNSASTQTPLVNRVYLYRSFAVTTAIEACIRLAGSNDLNRSGRDNMDAVGNICSSSIGSSDGSHQCVEQQRQLLVLGVGLDDSIERRYHSHQRQHSYEDERIMTDWKIFAVDLDRVIQQRKSHREYEMNTTSTIEIAADLTDVNTLRAKLIENDFDFSEKSVTIVVTEVVLGYNEPQDVQNLLTFLSSEIMGICIHVSFDPLLPPENNELYDDSNEIRNPTINEFEFARDFRSFFRERGAPLRFSRSSTTLQRQFFTVDGGYRNAFTLTVSEFLSCFPSPCGLQSLISEPFDEFHSLALINQLYGLTIASNNVYILDSVIQLLLSDEFHPWNLDHEAHLEFTDQIKMSRKKIIREYKLVSPEIATSFINDEQVTIREATEVDVGAICSLMMEGFSDVIDKYASVRKFVKNAKTQVLKDLRSKSSCILVACTARADSEAIIGCAGVGINNENDAEIRHMAVAESFRRRGLGRQLLQTVLRRIEFLTGMTMKSIRAHKWGHDKSNLEVHLSVVNELKSAQRLYHSMGFVEKGREALKDGCLLIHMMRDSPNE